ncbi:MAG TPA: transcriptional initiation protein Tat, partial [Polyangia bacterium]
NSLVFMSSEIMSGNAHDQANKGVLVVGGAAGRFRTGQHVAYPGAPQANLFISMLNALQVPVTAFGAAGQKPLDGLS